MTPAHFPGENGVARDPETNKVLVPFEYNQEEGVFKTVWIPSDADKQLIAAGGSIEVYIASGEMLPPHGIHVRKRPVKIVHYSDDRRKPTRSIFHVMTDMITALEKYEQDNPLLEEARRYELEDRK